MDLPASFKDYEAYLKLVRVGLKDAPELRAKVVQALVHKVEVLPSAFRIHFYVGKSITVAEDVGLGKASHGPPGVPQKHESPELLAPGFSIFSNRGSNRLTNGWPSGCTAEPLTALLTYEERWAKGKIDPLELVTLREAGLTWREIAKSKGVGKTTVLRAMREERGRKPTKSA